MILVTTDRGDGMITIKDLIQRLSELCGDDSEVLYATVTIDKDGKIFNYDTDCDRLE